MRRHLNHRGDRGLGLIEVVIASGIGMVAIFAAVTLMVRSTGENVKSDAANEGWLEGTSAGAKLNLQLKNIVRIDPPEDLVDDGDKLYAGIVTLPKAIAPKDCIVDANHSAVQMTSIALKQSSERILRRWVSSSAGKTSPTDELRISYQPGKSSFGAESPPTELFLLDIDGMNKRRYAVASFENRETEQHPLDDLPRVGPDGKNIKFFYTAVFLEDPLRPDGRPTLAPNPAISFISDSTVFPSRTVTTCMAVMPVGGPQKEAPTLVEVHQGQKRTLVNLGNSGRLHFRRFLVEFSATKSTLRMDELDWYPTIDTDRLLCLNMVRFSLLLTVNEPRAAAGAPGERKVEISREVLLPNFMMKRAVSCE